MLRTEGIVVCFNDVAVMSDAIQLRCRHLGVAEHLPPLAEGKIGRNDQRGLFVELADQMKQQRAAGLRKRQVAKLIEYHCIHLRKLASQRTCLVLPLPTKSSAVLADI